jgi:hypothetical protein
MTTKTTKTIAATMSALEISAEYDRLVSLAVSAGKNDDWIAYKAMRAAATKFARDVRSALCRKVDGIWCDSVDGIWFDRLETQDAVDFVQGYALRRATDRRDARRAI